FCWFSPPARGGGAVLWVFPPGWRGGGRAAGGGARPYGPQGDFPPSLRGEGPVTAEGARPYGPQGDFSPSLLGEYRRSRGGGRFSRRKPLSACDVSRWRSRRGPSP